MLKLGNIVEINKSLNYLGAHLLSAVLEKEYGCIIATIQIDEDGFYIDVFNPNEALSTNGFAKIEKAIQKLCSGVAIEYQAIDKKEAKKSFSNNKYIQYAIDNSSKDKINLIKINSYQNLCDLLPYEKTNVIKFIKLLSIGGSYWLGDANNEQLIRIRGFVSDDKTLFENFVAEYQDRIERDHRTIGKNLDLFTFNNLAGQGLPFWLPNGTIIRKQIRNFLGELEFKFGFESTYTPPLGSIELYKQSGHWDHYNENMFAPITVDNEQLVLRPMTCPHHILIYKRKPLSYKQLPLRLCEESMLHRYESSGGLTGFERVREMVLEDTHIFCTPEQLEQEVLNCYNLITEVHKGLDLKLFSIDLSLHDPLDKQKYHHDEKMWKEAEASLRTMLNKLNIKYEEKVGEAAFYGPKIDFQVKTVLGRIITLSTIQLDFLLPERFELTYKANDGTQQPTVMVHLGMMGTYERLLSIILEQTKGILPLWLSPIQIALIAVNDEIHGTYLRDVYQTLRNQFIRAEIDNRDERMSKKIRDAQISKIPYQIIIGDEEITNKNISYREYGSEQKHTLNLDKFIQLIKTRIDNKN